MKKQILMFLVALLCTFSSFAVSRIWGSHYVCTGNSFAPRDSTFGGTWTSSNPAVARFDSVFVWAGHYEYGCFTSIAPGTAVITYTSGGSSDTFSISVGHYTGSLASGSTNLCIGDSTVLVNTIPGGTWISGNESIATCYGFDGVVHAMAYGVAIIYYHYEALCTGMITITVGVGNDSIAGSSIICIGSTTPYTDPISGGTWSSGNTAIATISTGGLVTGIAAGTASISYHLAGGTCGPAFATKVIRVNGPAIPPPIGYSTSTIPVGATDTFTNATPGGTWTSSNPSVAYINAATGIITGVTLGTATISYSVCGGLPVTQVVSIVPLDGISGHINFSTTYRGLVTVWLIKYNPSTMILSAVDSIAAYNTNGSSMYYKFVGLSTDSFRIKASINYSGSIGYTLFAPTYGNSSAFWNSANVVYHVSGASDIGNDVNMIPGIITAGSGFIAGDVTTGANRGTSTATPAVGLNIYLLNSSNQVMQMTQTDVSGHYMFSNLPVGATYKIVPEALNYTTIPYSSITLTSSATYMSAANFVQHTLSKTITPITEGVSNIGSTENTVLVYPNPTNGALNVAWNANASEVGTLILSDISGRELLNKSINIRQGSGSEQVDLSGFNTGIYFLSLRSGQINYNTKIQVNY